MPWILAVLTSKLAKKVAAIVLIEVATALATEPKRRR